MSIDKTKLKSLFLKALPIYIAFVFIQSLFFKFSAAPETIYIFTVLDNWAANTFGLNGLFLPPGIFNAYVIGSAELVASILLLLGLLKDMPKLVFLGALTTFGIISGAIFFHLATPLGVNVQGDGGTLFYMACGVWASSLILLITHKNKL